MKKLKSYGKIRIIFWIMHSNEKRRDLDSPNIYWTVKHDLCVGCGICVDACPQKSITINHHNGLFRPVVDAEHCNNKKGCHRCFDVCPGIGIGIKEIGARELSDDNVKEDVYIGRYVNYYVGHSTDENIRYHCASGGLTSQIIIYLLEKKIIDGAVVTRFDNKNPLMVQTFIAQSRDEVLEAKSSKYAPVTMAGIAAKIKERTGKYVIVGLPCHIHGFRKLELKDTKFKEHVFAYFGLYCSCGRSYNLTEYTLKKNGIGRDHLKNFAYRDNGCMGNLKIQYSQKKILSGEHGISEKELIKDLEIPFQKYYLTLRSFFNVHRCLFCVDHFAELADISFGDIHFGKYIEDKIGINSVVTRRDDLDRLIKDAKRDRVITLEKVDKNDLLSSQKYVRVKKHMNPTIMKVYLSLGHSIPQYDEEFQLAPFMQTMKSLLVKKIQMFIGNHKCLWWMIKLGKKNMDAWS